MNNKFGIKSFIAYDLSLIKQQVDANIKLMIYLTNKHPSIDYLFGHNEVQGNEELDMLSLRNREVLYGEPDPGVSFMKEIISGIKELYIMAR